MPYAFYTTVQKVRPHSNADRLDVVTVFGMDTIAAKGEWKDGDQCIYFAVGAQLNKNFLKKRNLYRKSELNEDVNQKGYFEPNGRVTALKLRGEMSDGVIFPIAALDGVVDAPGFKAGLELDKIGAFVLAEKYIPQGGKSPSGVRNYKRKKRKYIPEHIDTKQLAYNIDKFGEEFEAQLTYKLHGTSGRFAHRNRPWWKFWEPKFIGGTRRVEFYENGKATKARENYRMKYHRMLSKIIPKGYMLYFEIVGWEGPGERTIMPTYPTTKLDKAFQEKFGPKMIFSYGCKEGENELWVYRVTHNDRELSPTEIKAFCRKYGLKYVPEVAPPDGAQVSKDGWATFRDKDQLIEHINAVFETVEDPIDSSHVLEGIVVRLKNEINAWNAYKIKTFEFKLIDDINVASGSFEGLSQDEIEEMA